LIDYHIARLTSRLEKHAVAIFPSIDLQLLPREDGAREARMHRAETSGVPSTAQVEQRAPGKAVGAEAVQDRAWETSHLREPGIGV
jgi:hypothetical protein